MLQLSALSLGLIRVFLLSRGWLGSFLCGSSGFSPVMPTEMIFLLLVAETVIQSELKSFFALSPALTAKSVDWLLYA